MKTETDKKKKLYSIFIISVFLIGFIIFYFQILNFFYYPIPIILVIGFSIIIVAIFYFFLKLIHYKNNIIIFNIKILNEKTIKIILITLMVITFFIPPVSFSKVIVDWNRIGLLNYIRAIVFLIGCAFIPGASFFRILFPKCTLHEKFKIEPFFFKLAIYPLISFIVLGFATLVLELVGLKREGITIALLSFIILLLIIDILLQKFNSHDLIKLGFIKIKVSIYTFYILFVSLGIIIIAMGIHFATLYTYPIDHYRSISHALYIGSSTTYKNYTPVYYSIFWGYISYSLSVLCGIPYININALLFPFLYLFITSTYLLIKAVLKDVKEIYAVLSTLFTITYSGILFFYRFPDYQTILITDGLLFFRYKSFAIFLNIMASALFIITIKSYKKLEIKSFFKTENIRIIILAALFFISCYMIYSIIVIPGFIVIFLFGILSNNKKKDCFILIIFLSFLIILYIFIDLISGFFYTWTDFKLFLYILNQPYYKLGDYALIYNAIKIYLILIVFHLFFIFNYYFFTKSFSKNEIKRRKKIKISYYLIFSLFLILIILIYILFLERRLSNFISSLLSIPNTTEYIFLDIICILIISISFSFFPIIFYFINKKNHFKRSKMKNNNRINPKAIFILSLLFFSLFLILEIFVIIIMQIYKIEITYPIYYLNHIFLHIGLIGILGVYSSYFCFKKNKNLFYILSSWIFIVIFISSLLIISNWIRYSSSSFQNIPSNKIYTMEILFSRIWYFSIFPFSIFSSIGILELRKYLSIKLNSINKKINIYHKTLIKLTSISFLISLILSNLIYMAAIFYNYDDEYFLEDDEAQIMGWVSENIPNNEKIITNDYKLSRYIYGTIFRKTYYFKKQLMDFIDENSFPIINYDYDKDCGVNYVNYIDFHESVLELNDENNDGSLELVSFFDDYQTNGTIEFYIRTINKSKMFSIELKYEKTSILLITIDSNWFCCFNGSQYVKVLEIENNKWYPFIIDFECTNGNFKDLNKYNWKMNISGTEYGDYKFINNVSIVDSIQFYTNRIESYYTVFLNDLKYSWNPEINDIIYYASNLFINHLERKDIKYFIKSNKKERGFKNLAKNILEEYGYFFFNIDDILYYKLYDRKLYEYGDLAIYKD